MTLQSFFVRGTGQFIRIIPEEVLFITVDDNYVQFFTEHTKSEPIRTSLDAVLKKLPQGMFLQTHRSHAAGVKHIYSVSKEMVTFFPDPKNYYIPMSKEFYSAFIKKITIIEPVRSNRAKGEVKIK